MANFYGGDQGSIGDIYKRVAAVLHPLPSVDCGWRFQCRCGSTAYCKYRGRYYCHRCGRRYKHPDAQYFTTTPVTFRTVFEANIKKEA